MNKLKQKLKDKLGEKKLAKIKRALPTIRLIKNIICWTLIALIAVAVIIFAVTRITGGTPSIFGYSIHRVLTGSMEPELSVNEIILNKDISDPAEISQGDIVTFKGDAAFDGREVTHRVVTAPHADDSGNILIVTKGDANTVEDGEISADSIQSKVVAKLPFLKWLFNFFFSIWGLIIFLIILTLLFIDEIRNIVRVMSKSLEDEDQETFRETMERIRREDAEKAAQQNDSKDPDDSNSLFVKGNSEKSSDKTNPKSAESRDSKRSRQKKKKSDQE